MGKIYRSITELVGKTPLLELANYEKKHDLSAKLLVKLEYFNPNQSIKDRTALNMIEEAEKKGLIKPGGYFGRDDEWKYRNRSGSDRSNQRI